MFFIMVLFLSGILFIVPRCLCLYHNTYLPACHYTCGIICKSCQDFHFVNKTGSFLWFFIGTQIRYRKDQWFRPNHWVQEFHHAWFEMKMGTYDVAVLFPLFLSFLYPLRRYVMWIHYKISRYPNCPATCRSWNCSIPDIYSDRPRLNSDISWPLVHSRFSLSWFPESICAYPEGNL